MINVMIVLLKEWGEGVEVMMLRTIVDIGCYCKIQGKTSARHDVNRRGEGSLSLTSLRTCMTLIRFGVAPLAMLLVEIWCGRKFLATNHKHKVYIIIGNTKHK